jgi:hypothetical protein
MRGDVVVIGSGPIGAVIARRFAEAGRIVTMFEAGPAISDPPGYHVRNLARFQNDPDSFLAGIADRFTYFDERAPPAGLPGASTTAAVGGQGVLWTNNCPRPSAFEQWTAMPAPEWDHYLGEAERYLGVHDDTFTASVRQQRIVERLRVPLAEAGREIRGQPMAGRLLDPSTPSIHYVATHDVLVGTGVVVQTGDVRRVVLEGPRASAVELYDDARIDASVVIVAAGGRPRHTGTPAPFASSRAGAWQTPHVSPCLVLAAGARREAVQRRRLRSATTSVDPAECCRTLEHDGAAGHVPHAASAARYRRGAEQARRDPVLLPGRQPSR